MTWIRGGAQLILFACSAVLLLGGGGAWLLGAVEISKHVWVAGTILGVAFSGAWTVAALRRRQPSVDIIALLALAGALWVDEPFVGAMITVMLASGR